MVWCGRSVNREAKLKPVVITVFSMGFGSIILFIISLIVEGFPALSLESAIYISWLAAVNTAFAFTLWNLTLRRLTAVESSIINGTMLIQIAILAWIFLGENLTFNKICGMIIVSLGAFFVQLKFKKDCRSVPINLTNEIEYIIFVATLIKGLPHTLYLKELKPGDRPIIGLFYF
jgi:drug/metabolite transporter (DMT)-like permease